ncbi:MAG: ABC transporter ATP-binding protein [Syntrophomonas sp.]|jgi:ABC-2 type transport system ATP-binding protein|nr:ABC transporter ATP-binding protein [Syntrophomonas sp.]
MIELNGVSKHFDGIEALQNISLDIDKGSIYGLVGSNGAGKTTLLKILAGVYKQDEGQVHIDSQPVFENNEAKAHMVFIPDFLYFFHNYSIQDMAVFYRCMYPRWDQDRYLKLQDVFNLDVKRPIKTLSKGMRRQVAFWLGLSIMPDVMILDEPLDGLDPVMRQKVKNLIIQDVADREMTVIISSHNLRDLEDICDCIGILHQGVMLIQKALDDLKTDVHKIQIAFTEGIPLLLLQNVPLLYREERGSVLILIARGSHDELIEHIRSYNPAIVDILPLTLEEIFIYEMGDNGYEIKNILY